MKRNRYTYQDVYNIFKRENWCLLSSNYKNNKQSLDVLCSKHHKIHISLNNFLRGWRCVICAGRKKHSINEIRIIFKNKYWKLLSLVYKNNKQRLNVLCNKGHKIQISLNNFLRGWRCKKCAIIRNSGEKNSQWNSNKTNEERVIERKLIENSEWIQKVLKRDNYTCQRCNDNKGHNLNAHHLEGYHWCIELRFELSNGVTLCEKCHSQFHKLFGFKWNTSEQFYQFLRRT